MKDHIALINEFGADGHVMHAVNRVMKTRVRLEMRDVLETARREIVYHIDFIAALKISVREMRPDEARPARD